MLVWMDLEMTGLDPSRHVIVEIATLVTDDELEIVAEGPDLVVHQPPDVLAGMDGVVRTMHTKSGLLAAIESSTVSLEEAGRTTLEFIKGLESMSLHEAAQIALGNQLRCRSPNNLAGFHDTHAAACRCITGYGRRSGPV